MPPLPTPNVSPGKNTDPQDRTFSWDQVTETPDYLARPGIRVLRQPGSNRSIVFDSRKANINFYNDYENWRRNSSIGPVTGNYSTQASPAMFTVGADGQPIPMSQDAQDLLDAGYTPQPSDFQGGTDQSTGTSDSGDSAAPPAIVIDENGQIASADPQSIRNKIDTLSAQFTQQLLQERLSRGQTTALAPLEMRMLEQQARSLAIQQASVWAGGNPENAPQPVADLGAIPEIKAGQLFPTLNGVGIDNRPLDQGQADTLNWMRNSGVVEKEQATSILAMLMDPTVPTEVKQQQMQAMTAARTQMQESAPTFLDTVRNVLDRGPSFDPFGAQGTFQPGLNPVMWVPRTVGFILSDYVLPPLNSFYSDYVDPTLTWSVSALPGGPRTATYDEAKSISGGQMISTVAQQFAPLVAGPLNPGIAQLKAGNYVLGAFNLMQGLNPATALTNMGSMSAASMAAGASPLDAVTAAGMGMPVGNNAQARALMPWLTEDPNQIYNTDWRERTFEENALGSATSGTIGFGTVMVWDPLLVAGPAMKAFRVSHRLGMGAGMIRSAEDVQRASTVIQRDVELLQPYEAAVKNFDDAVATGDQAAIDLAQQNLDAARAAKSEALKDASSLGVFLDWVAQPGRTSREIRRHSVMRSTHVNQTISEGLLRAKTMEERALILRASWGDMDALQSIRNVSLQLHHDIAVSQARVQVDNIIAAPDEFVKVYRRTEKEVDDALKEYNRLAAESLDQTSARSATAATDPAYVQGSQENLDRLVMEEGNAQIERLNQAVREARAAGAPQEVIHDLWRQLDAAADRANAGLFGGVGAMAAPEELYVAHRNVQTALYKLRALDEADVFGHVRTPQEVADEAARLEELLRQDVVFRAAWESAGGMLGNRVNFGRGRMQAAARGRERARQRSAERTAFQQETHNSRGRWVKESYKMGTAGESFTLWNWIPGAKAVVADAITRPFTYSLMESPAGYLKVKGLGSMDNVQEAEATVDNLLMYTDKATDWARTKGGQSVTGVERKREVVDRFVRDTMDPRKSGVQVIETFEKDILFDMIRRYMVGIIDEADRAEFVKEIRQMYKFFDAERARQIKMIKEQNYWVDEVGKKHGSPFLDSQLVESMPIMDFRRAERLVADLAKDYNKPGRRRVVTPAKARAVDAAAEGTAISRAQFDEAVRLRDEAQAALDEATPADLQSLLIKAGQKDKDAINALRPYNAARKNLDTRTAAVTRLKNNLDRAFEQEASMNAQSHLGREGWNTTLKYYDRFQVLWRASVLFRLGYPTRNTIDGLARTAAYEASLTPLIEDAIQGTKNLVSNVATGRTGRTASRKQAKVAKFTQELKDTGALPRAVRKWADREHQRITTFRDNQAAWRDEQQAWLDQARAQLPNIAKGERDQFEQHMYDVLQAIKGIDAVVADLDAKLAWVAREADPSRTIIAYRQSLDRPRRLGDEVVVGVDGRTYWGARSDPRFSPILMQEASARETVQATLAMRLSASRSRIAADAMTLGGRVRPGDVNYFSELTKVLNRQVRNSMIGRAFLSGKTEEDAARLIMSREGEKYRALHGIESIEDAQEKAIEAFAEFRRYMPSPTLQQSLRNGILTEDEVKRLLSDPAYIKNLVEIHGTEISFLAGSSEAMGLWNRTERGINRVYELIGSGPEDLFVRMPFASRRYAENVRLGSALIAEYFPEGVPGWAVDVMLNSARRRAIKDTKTYLYTQPRRTNLGKRLEPFIPFISAWQNSIVAYGRLIAMNPETLYFASQAWEAPNRMGIQDQQGNIRIPIPAALAPVTEWTGMGDEWVYNKNSLYVLPQAVDPVMTFRAGPILQMPASALMQAGWLGPAAPTALRWLGLSDSDAQKVWDVAIRATFGTDQRDGEPLTMGTLPLGADKGMPILSNPAVQKIVQAAQTAFGNSPENNTTYAFYYNTVARDEMLKYWRGERSTVPGKDEIKTKVNANYMLRGLTNIIGVTGGPFGLITPNQIDSDLLSMVELYRTVQDTMGPDEADKWWLANMGDEALFLMKYRSSASPGAVPTTVEAIARAEQNQQLISGMAPRLTDLRMLGFMLGDGNAVENEYDPNSRLIQFFRDIPGTSEQMRKALSPEESQIQASISTGWALYDQFMGAIYAELDARGLSSLQSADAKPLADAKDQFLKQMAADPLYADWWTEYDNGSEDRVGSALMFIRSVTSDQSFMDAHGGNTQDMWRTALIYLDERARVKADFEKVGDNETARKAIRDRWLDTATMISESNPRFRSFWVRYLDSDDLTDA